MRRLCDLAKGVGLGGVAAGGDDLVAALDELTGEFEAEAAVCAGDEVSHEVVRDLGVGCRCGASYSHNIRKNSSWSSPKTGPEGPPADILSADILGPKYCPYS